MSDRYVRGRVRGRAADLGFENESPSRPGRVRDSSRRAALLDRSRRGDSVPGRASRLRSRGVGAGGRRQEIAVGAPVDALQSFIPVEQRRPTVESNGIVYDSIDYDVAAGITVPDDDPDYYTGQYWGAHARGENGVVVFLGAPSLHVDLC